MSTSSASTILVKSLYRSLLKQSRIIDKSPIHQCFLISKPKKIYIHEYGTPVNVRLYNTDNEIVERILNEYCGGEYYAPSYPNQESKSLQYLVKQYFRFGVPSKYDPLKVLDPTTKNQSDQQILNKYLELAFYTKKRLSYSTNVINKRAFNNNINIIEENDSNNQNENGGNGGKYTRMKLASQFSIKSLTPLISDLSINDAKQISKGTLLISHPLACLGQPDLSRKVIYIIENSVDRIVGITLNSAHSIFDDNPKRNNKNKNINIKQTNQSISINNSNEYEYCFRGWKGEYNYIGGPVNDTNCPFCILHKNKIFHNKFKESSTIIIDNPNVNQSDITYWTWVTADNYQGVYHALNQITKVIQYKNDGENYDENHGENHGENQSEISGKNQEENDNKVDDKVDNKVDDKMDNKVDDKVDGKVDNKVDEAQIVSESDDIVDNEFYDSIMNDNGNTFKFFQKYSYWSPEQLLVEIKNNVWFPAKLNDINEEKQLLDLKCPTSKLLGVVKDQLKDNRIDYKKQYNKWMWQAFVKGLGNEYKYLAVFPDLTNEQTKEFYSFMEEFHNSWVPDVEHEAFDSDDEPEEEGTDVW